MLSIVTTLSYAFLPVLCKCLHAMLVKSKACTDGGEPLLLSPLLRTTTHISLCSQRLFGLQKRSESISDVNGCCFFLHGGVQ